MFSNYKELSFNKESILAKVSKIVTKNSKKIHNQALSYPTAIYPKDCIGKELEV